MEHTGRTGELMEHTGRTGEWSGSAKFLLAAGVCALVFGGAGRSEGGSRARQRVTGASPASGAVLSAGGVALRLARWEGTFGSGTVLDQEGRVVLTFETDPDSRPEDPFVTGRLSFAAGGVLLGFFDSTSFVETLVGRVALAYPVDGGLPLFAFNSKGNIYPPPPKEILPRPVWVGRLRVGADWHRAKLYKVRSRRGIRRNGIDTTLALAVYPRLLSASAPHVVVIQGGRLGVEGATFSPDDGVAPLIRHNVVDIPGQLGAGDGNVVVFAEYRGSIRPGGEDQFDPPLQPYGRYIPGYDTGGATELGHGDVSDVLAVVRFVQANGTGVRPASVSVAGISHGGYLALEAAHGVSGIHRVVARHPPTDFRAMAAWMRNAPETRYSYFPQDRNPREILSGGTRRLGVVVDGEKLLNRVLPAAGGESEFNERPGCRLYANDHGPKSSQILLIQDVNDWIVSANQVRNYYLRWHGSYPGIRLLEFATQDNAAQYQDPIYGHGSPWETDPVSRYLADGSVGDQPGRDPILRATVTVTVRRVGSLAPLPGAKVEVSPEAAFCMPAAPSTATTSQSGEATLSHPAGFVTVNVSLRGYASQRRPLYLDPRAPSGQGGAAPVTFDLAPAGGAATRVHQ